MNSSRISHLFSSLAVIAFCLAANKSFAELVCLIAGLLDEKEGQILY
jgi:hypothetical protein